MIADQTGGQLEAALAERHAVLLDQQDMAVVDREDHRRADAACAADVFPPAALLGGDELALPDDLFGRVALVGRPLALHVRSQEVRHGGIGE